MKDTGIKFETLRKGFNFKKIFIGLVVIVIIGSVIILKGSKANYTYQEIIPFAEGVVRIRKSDLNLMAVNLQKTKGSTEYTATTNVPTSGYIFNTTKSYCTVDNGTSDVTDSTIPMEYENGAVNIKVKKKGTRCYLYFDIATSPKTMKQIITDNYKTVLTRTSFSSTVTASTTGTIYKSANSNQNDDDGEVYYFAGAPTDNWVKFGKDINSKDIWWRIIRINGDGSLRMIYAGTGTSAPATTGTGTQISSTGFAPTGTTSTCAGGKASSGYCYYDNKFVGYMFNGDQGTASTNYDNAHNISGSGTKSNSNVKTVLDTWYNANLTDKATYISDDVGFCGDRSSSTTSSGTPAKNGGYGTTGTYYGAYYRNYTNKQPSFKCTYKENDLYTTPNQKNKGNKALRYPIGLITADEVVFAGGVYNTTNKSFYLYTGSAYMTMSPSGFNSNGNAFVFYVHNNGNLDYYFLYTAYGVRPVINIKADVTFAAVDGSTLGTSSNPYVVMN